MKPYIRQSFKEFLISLIFPFIIYFIVKDKSIVYVCVVVNLIGLIPGYYRYSDQLLFNAKLKERGLTFKDLNNIAFVKKWGEIRERGVIKYTIVDGGVFFGFALCGIISIAAMLILKDTIKYITTDIANMFNFIGWTYLLGVMSGIILYRLLWIYKEQKFVQLTDPLHYYEHTDVNWLNFQHEISPLHSILSPYGISSIRPKPPAAKSRFRFFIG